MRFGTLQFRYFDEGDYVRTPDGVGLVAKDEPEINTERDFWDRDITIQHKFGCSNNASNRPIEVSRDCVLRIDQDEYDSEEKF